MKTIEVAAAIIKHNDKILVTRRSYGEFIDMWEFPGGKIEPSETREEALIREIKEELEVNISILDYLTTIEYDYPAFHLIMHCFICSICSGELHLNAHNQAKWITCDRMDDLNWVPADISVAKMLKKVY
ncbi:mutator mutT protein [Clostridiales bacterium oral taxon 876 str. F0540]|nr:mutator mutT protein [Clostridiales bacterium oral taxon 876 str. F0540]